MDNGIRNRNTFKGWYVLSLNGRRGDLKIGEKMESAHSINLASTKQEMCKKKKIYLL